MGGSDAAACCGNAAFKLALKAARDRGRGTWGAGRVAVEERLRARPILPGPAAAAPAVTPAGRSPGQQTKLSIRWRSDYASLARAPASSHVMMISYYDIIGSTIYIDIYIL